ncbi:hypothetical protein [Kitasatospora terrestris]|uniref:Glyoxalase-like domain-containing protein n=1 Tax=Kitasatospora terrestris TaxID=258051 RepID=A0ABP9DKB0_9ACTN
MPHATTPAGGSPSGSRAGPRARRGGRGHNTFVRAELHTDDQEATVGFHRSLFGRRAGDPGIPGVEYTVLMTESGGDDPAVGRIAVLADPFGARFALLRPEPRS